MAIQITSKMYTMCLIPLTLIFFLGFVSHSLGFPDCSSEGLDPLKVEFENDKKINVEAGTENIDFKCVVNREPLCLYTKLKVNIVHVNRLTSKEKTLSSNGHLQEGPPAFYSVKIDPSKGFHSTVVDFAIKKVRSEDDGYLRCKVTSSRALELVSVDREVFVHSNQHQGASSSSTERPTKGQHQGASSSSTERPAKGRSTPKYHGSDDNSGNIISSSVAIYLVLVVAAFWSLI